jgi:hypothetical protein
MAEKLASVLSWLRTEGVLSVKFEDLIGPQGGGVQKNNIRVFLLQRSISVFL